MAKLTDPSDKIVYEMHQYLDSDGSGTATACVSSTIGRERLADATAWLKQNNKKGIIGETAGGANAQCIDALKDMLSFMEDNSDVWAGGLWWGGEFGDFLLLLLLLLLSPLLPSRLLRCSHYTPLLFCCPSQPLLLRPV